MRSKKSSKRNSKPNSEGNANNRPEEVDDKSTDQEETPSAKRTPRKALSEESSEDSAINNKKPSRKSTTKPSEETSEDSALNNKRTPRKSTTKPPEQEASSPKRLRGNKESPAKQKGRKSGGKAKPAGREYEVEAILGQKKSEKGLEEFLVKWKGYDEKDNSWVPKANLNCQRLLENFLKTKAK